VWDIKAAPAEQPNKPRIAHFSQLIVFTVTMRMRTLFGRQVLGTAELSSQGFVGEDLTGRLIFQAELFGGHLSLKLKLNE
jgi:hypothetical protein